MCAQFPTDDNKADIMGRFSLTTAEFEQLKILVPKFMVHDNGNNHRTKNGQPPWCHVDGKCSTNYPKCFDPLQESSYVDEHGYVVYKRLV